MRAGSRQLSGRALDRRQHRDLRDLEAAAAAFEAGAEELQARAAVDSVDLDTGHRVRRAAGCALDLQAAAEADEIGGVPHMLGGHSCALAP